MQLKLSPSMLLLLGILLACSMVEGACIPERGLSDKPLVNRRSLWPRFDFKLDLRKLGGGLGGAKPKPAAPKPAAPKPADPKPAEPKPANAKPSPANGGNKPSKKPDPDTKASKKPDQGPKSSKQPDPNQKPSKAAPEPSKAPPEATKSAQPKSENLHSKSQVKTTDPASGAQSQTTISASSTISVPRKCDTNSCGAGLACPAPTGTESAPNTKREDGLAERAFFSMEGNGATEKLAKQASNQDVSAFPTRFTQFIPFNGKDPRSVTIVGLEGCTAIAVFSNQGMVVEHLFESAAEDPKTKKVDLTNTLHPSTLDDTLKEVKDRLAANKAKFANGQAVLMLPMNPAKGQNSKFKYDSEEALAFNAKTGKFDPNKGILSEGVVDDIREMITSATDIKAQEVQYIPPLDDDEAAANEKAKSPKGTFAIQYDPNNGPENKPQNAVQVFAEGKAVLAKPFNFETASQ